MKAVIEFVYCGHKFEAVLTCDDIRQRALFDDLVDEMKAILEGEEV